MSNSLKSTAKYNLIEAIGTNVPTAEVLSIAKNTDKEILFSKPEHLKGLDILSGAIEKALVTNRIELIEPLIDLGFNLETEFEEGKTTLLSRAVRSNRKELVELLLKRGAKVNLNSKLKRKQYSEIKKDSWLIEERIWSGGILPKVTPLAYSIKNKNLDIIKLLVEYKADIGGITLSPYQTAEGYSPSSYSHFLLCVRNCEHCNDILKYLTDKSLVDKFKKNVDKRIFDKDEEFNILNLLCVYENLEIETIQHIFSTNLFDKFIYEKFPGEFLASAVRQNKKIENFILVLKFNKQFINTQDEDGNTPLHYIDRNDDFRYLKSNGIALEKIKLLFENGADPSIKNNEGEDFFDILEQRKKSDYPSWKDYNNNKKTSYNTKENYIASEICRLAKEQKKLLDFENKLSLTDNYTFST